MSDSLHTSSSPSGCVNTALICLGSNTADAGSRLADACRLIGRHATVTARTEPYRTADEYAPASCPPYLNQLLRVTTAIGLDVLHHIFKEHERVVRPLADAPAVAIDIDIVVWNDITLKPRDMASNYLRQGLPLLSAAT